MSGLNPQQFEAHGIGEGSEYESLRSAHPPYRLPATPRPKGAAKGYEGPGAFHCDHPLCDGSQGAHENHEGGTSTCENQYCNREEVAGGEGHCRGCAGVREAHPDLDDWSVKTHPKWSAFHTGQLKR